MVSFKYLFVLFEREREIFIQQFISQIVPVVRAEPCQSQSHEPLPGLSREPGAHSSGPSSTAFPTHSQASELKMEWSVLEPMAVWDSSAADGSFSFSCKDHSSSFAWKCCFSFIHFYVSFVEERRDWEMNPWLTAKKSKFYNAFNTWEMLGIMKIVFFNDVNMTIEKPEAFKNYNEKCSILVW